jgi:DNA polymerase III alpha subunit
MELVRPHVVELEKRMKERGMAAEVIKQITDQMTAAGRYAFNRSHAECYAYLSYACAYLSCHYPLAFYKWLITMAGDEEERVKYVSAALGRGIAVLPPHVNQSGVGFTIEGNSLRVGLRSVRGVGEITAQEIIAKRPFADAGQVVKSVNRGVYAALCAAGALQGLPDLDQNPPAAKLEEIAVLGMSLGGGKTYEEEIRRLKAVSFHEIQEESKAVVMIISTVKKHIDKNQHAMAFLTMLDVHGPRGEGVMFADTYKQNPPREDVLYWGIMSRTPKGFIVHQIMEIERLREMWKMQDAAKKEGR